VAEEMSLIMDEHGIPFGWEDVTLTEEELLQLSDALDRGEREVADRVVEGAYERFYARLGGHALN
jgi:hypothetical protein